MARGNGPLPTGKTSVKQRLRVAWTIGLHESKHAWCKEGFDGRSISVVCKSKPEIQKSCGTASNITCAACTSTPSCRGSVRVYARELLVKPACHPQHQAVNCERLAEREQSSSGPANTVYLLSTVYSGAGVKRRHVSRKVPVLASVGDRSRTGSGVGGRQLERLIAWKYAFMLPADDGVLGG